MPRVAFDTLSRPCRHGSQGARLGDAEKRRVAQCRGASGLRVLVTADKNIRYQQNLKGRKIALVVLDQGRWGPVRRALAEIAAAVNAATPGSYTEVDILFD
jgi:hypothetical protein